MTKPAPRAGGIDNRRRRRRGIVKNDPWNVELCQENHDKHYESRERAPGRGDGWRGAQGGRGVGHFGSFRGASRRANPRLAPRVRPHAARGPGARTGRMGRDVGPAFQRRYRDP
eukprot:gene18177-biopygen9928